jgi:hypothetical protein
LVDPEISVGACGGSIRMWEDKFSS